MQCPSHLSDLRDSSPKVCKPYLVARSHIEPYIAPYYNAYAAPYVDKSRPYVEAFDQHVYTPTAKIAQVAYRKYGAPAWQQTQAYGAAQWKVHITPQIQLIKDQSYRLYMDQIDPYMQQGLTIVSPYYQRAKGAALAVYRDVLVPFYTWSQPFLGMTYNKSQEVLTTHVMPCARYTWSSVVYFTNSSLWPQITGLYSEKV